MFCKVDVLKVAQQILFGLGLQIAPLVAIEPLLLFDEFIIIRHVDVEDLVLAKIFLVEASNILHVV